MKCLNRQMVLLVTAGFLCAGGCGTETYNQRLDETRKLFVRINELNENLGILWNNSGVEIRMPRQLTEIPPPPKEVNEYGELVEVGEDERQPSFMAASVEVPGLIGAWKGKVEAAVGEKAEQGVPADAYAYVLSNAYLWAKSEEEDALNFKNTAAEAVMDGLSLPLFEESDWKREDYPESKTDFIPQQSANVWLTDTEVAVDPAHPEVEYEVSLHLFQNRDIEKNIEIQVAVLFVYPKKFAAREHFSQRIDLALETIKISLEIPRGAMPTDQSGGKPGTF